MLGRRALGGTGLPALLRLGSLCQSRFLTREASVAFDSGA